VDMLWCQGAQNIGLSNRKLISTAYDHNTRQSQTDGRTNVMAIARRFVLKYHHLENAEIDCCQRSLAYTLYIEIKINANNLH